MKLQLYWDSGSDGCKHSGILECECGDLCAGLVGDEELGRVVGDDGSVEVVDVGILAPENIHL